MASLTGLVSFTAGTPAVASQVNTNFTAVKNFVESITTGVNIDAGVISFVKLAADVTNRLVPVGTIAPYAGATAPTGWLLCDGTTSTAGYPLLAAMVGATTPDMKGRFLLGKTAAGTGSTLLGTGGSSTITASNMPSHQHDSGTLGTVAVGNHQHTGVTTFNGFHAHTMTVDQLDATTAHGHGQDGTLVSGTNAEPDGETSAGTYGEGDHQHSFTTSADGGHGHTVNGATGFAGSGSEYFQPFIAVNYIVKHD